MSKMATKLLSKLGLGKKAAVTSEPPVRVLIAGHLGQVGSAISSICKDAGFEVYGTDLKKSDKIDIKKTPIDFLHICFGMRYQSTEKAAIETFAADCIKVIEKYQPRCCIIHSSVLPGTTNFIGKKVSCKIAYSPIRGQHDSLKRDILAYKKFLSPVIASDEEIFVKHFEAMKFKVRVYNRNPAELELTKLLDVCAYGVGFIFAQEQERIMKKYHFTYNALLNDFQAEHQDLYPDKRGVYFPGYAGGNCVRQDIELILLIFQSALLKACLESNNQYAKEQGIISKA